MKIRTKTSAEKRCMREKWKPVFALLPVEVGEGEWRWLETVETREINTVVQRRAIGSNEFWPPYPFKKDES